MNNYTVEEIKTIGSRGLQFFTKEIARIEEYADRRMRKHSAAIVFYNRSFNLFQCLNSDVTQAEIDNLHLAIDLRDFEEITVDGLGCELLTLLCAIQEEPPAQQQEWIMAEFAINRSELEILKSNINADSAEIVETVDQFDQLTGNLHRTMLVKLKVKHLSALWELGRSQEVVKQILIKNEITSHDKYDTLSKEITQSLNSLVGKGFMDVEISCFTLGSDRYLSKVKRNTLMDNEGYEYDFNVINLEKRCLLLDELKSFKSKS